MSVEVVVSGLFTEYRVWPPGFSQYPTDVGTEVVTKANSATAFAVGDIVVAGSVTSAGETWRAQGGGEQNAPELRMGRVTAASASGVPTVTIVRFQRSLLDTARCTKTVGIGESSQPQGAVDPMWPLTGTWGDCVAVAKPSGEDWSTQGGVYGYLSGGVTLYTFNSATANAAPIRWLAGLNGLRSGIGNVEGWIVQPRLLEANRGTLPDPDGAGEEVVRFTFGAPPNLLGGVYSNASRSTFSTTPTSNATMFLGSIVRIDTTTSPPAYGVKRGGYSRGMAREGILASYARRGRALTVAGDQGATVGMETVYTTIAGGIRVLAPALYPGVKSTGTSSGASAVPFDIALDVDLPAPIGNARIIWINCKNARILVPVLVQRTTGSAPAASMSDLQTYRPKAYASPDPTGTTPLQTYIRGWSHPYPLTAYANTGLAPVRIYQLPAVVAYNGTSTDTVDWQWVRFDHSTGGWSALTAYAGATWSGTRWQATVGAPPGFTADQCARVSLQVRVNGTAYIVGLGVPPGGRLYGEVTANINQRFGHYPYDVQPWHGPSHSDCRWVGHKGWHFTEQLTLPAITWGTCTVNYTAAKLVVDVGVQPSVAATARVSNIQNQTLWNRPRLRVFDPIRKVSASYFLSAPFNLSLDMREANGLAVIEVTSNPTSLTVANPQGTVASSQVVAQVFQFYRVDSDYGPVTYMRQAASSAVTIP